MSSILSDTRSLLEGDINSGRGQFGLGSIETLTADGNLWDFGRYNKYGFDPDALRTITLPTIGTLDTNAQPGHHVLVYNISLTNSLNINTSGGLLNTLGPESSAIYIAGEADPDWRVFNVYNPYGGNTTLQQAYENNLGEPLQLKRNLIPDRGPLAVYSDEAFTANAREDLFRVDASPGAPYSGNFIIVRNDTHINPPGTVFGPTILGFGATQSTSNSISIGNGAIVSTTSFNSLAYGAGAQVSISQSSFAIGVGTMAAGAPGTIAMGFSAAATNGVSIGNTISTGSTSINIGTNISSGALENIIGFNNTAVGGGGGNAIMSRNCTFDNSNTIMASPANNVVDRNVLLSVAGSTSTGSNNFSACYDISSDRGDFCFMFNTPGPGAGINSIGSINLEDTDPLLAHENTLNIFAANEVRNYVDETTNEVFIPNGSTRSPNFIYGSGQIQNVVYNAGAGTTQVGAILNIPTGGADLKIRAVGMTTRSVSNNNVLTAVIENTFLVQQSNAETNLGLVPAGNTTETLIVSNNSNQSAGGLSTVDMTIAIVPGIAPADSHYSIDLTIIAPDGFDPMVFNYSYEYLSIDNKL